MSVDTVLAALADPTRRQILDVLAASGAASASALAGEVPVSRQAIVKHLSVLEQAGLVQHHREGREIRFAVRPEPLTTTATWMTALATEWDARLAKIKRIAEES